MGLCLVQPPYNPNMKKTLFIILIALGFQMSSMAQEAQYEKPTWLFGVAAGANFNFYRGTTQQLTSDFIVPTAFHDGQGVGLFAAPLMEFHRPDSRFGFMLQAGYDSRKGTFDQVESPCNCPEDLNADLDYITIEPSLRIAPFKSNFYIYAGPRLAFNMNNNFAYQKGINPNYPEQVADPEVKGEFSNTNKSVISMQVGAGYDIPLSSETSQTKAVLSPFVSFQPYFGQNPRSTESWNLTTLRAGVALKFGRGHKVPVPEPVIVPVVVVPEVTFTINSPRNIPAEPTVTEIFPLRNYVYFDLGSTEIPNRYVKLRKDQVQDFKEDQVQFSTPGNMSGSEKRQMIVYYNVLNILGDRMVKDPTTTITLVGSSEKGPKDGVLMAESTKLYLVDVFGIEASRIKTEGRTKPKINEEQPGGDMDLVLLREGDRRVSIESNSPGLLMEFTSGPDAPLKPVRISPVQEAPVDSYVTFSNAGADTAFTSWSMVVKDENGAVQNVTFSNAGADTAFTSWSMVVKDENGAVQNFGPYTKESVSLPGKSILGTRPEGDYKITMIGQLESGETLEKETSAHLVLWTPPASEEMMRFSIIYEFNNSTAIDMYEKYLTNVVTPKIPENGKVKIQGHTDITGGEDNNLKLSLARANDTQAIIKKALAQAGRTDVKFEVSGSGEDQELAPYANKFPEERSYNRSVIIDIIPEK